MHFFAGRKQEDTLLLIFSELQVLPLKGLKNDTCIAMYAYALRYGPPTSSAKSSMIHHIHASHVCIETGHIVRGAKSKYAKHTRILRS